MRSRSATTGTRIFTLHYAHKRDTKKISSFAFAFAVNAQLFVSLLVSLQLILLEISAA